MKNYQIVESYGNFKHAGSKATNDCVEILADLGFEKLDLKRENDKHDFLSKFKRQWSFFRNWRIIYEKVETNSVLILQHPFHTRQLGRSSTLQKLKEKKNVKVISLIHDVELIRSIFPDSYYKVEMDEMISFADAIIVHNLKMKQWFIEYGVDENKLFSLDIFDYLNDESVEKDIKYSKNIQIAGNLSKEKSPYIYKLSQLSEITFDLFGINYDETDESSNISYHGAFAPDDVPKQLNKGFGLVWDGDSLETCSGATGNYLRFNNPHKLSLYLSSGIPVIIWKESAEAEFISSNKVGITVNSLTELPEKLQSITEGDYKQLLANTKILMGNLKRGFYLQEAIKKALNSLGD